MQNAQCNAKCIARVLCIMHSALCIVCVSPRLHAEVIDRILAVVGGVVITQSDANAAFELGLVAPRPSDDPIAAVLSQLIERQLVLVEVDRAAPPEPAADAIDRAAQDVRARFPTEEAYTAVLNRSGIDPARLRQTLRDRLRVETYIEQRFAGAADRRTSLVDEWINGLRRRADITYLYVQRR